MSSPRTVDVAAVRFDERGLVPVIVQDATDGRVLMLAYMNRATLEETIELGRTVFWSRSRAERWAKGDTSGDVQDVVELSLDCDGDTILARVHQRGRGACHTGERSCFDEESSP
jgi:phosphoribosyl-AMP cyclohydrolase